MPNLNRLPSIGLGVALALIFGACSGPGFPSTSSDILRSRQDAGIRYVIASYPGTVQLFTSLVLDELPVDVRIETVELLGGSASAEVLSSRLSFYRSARHEVFRGAPGQLCTSDYPPRGYGPTIDAVGASLEKGEGVALSFFIRSRMVGDASFGKVRISYVTESGSRHAQTLDGRKVDIFTRTKEAEFPSHSGECVPGASLWFGDSPYA